MSNFQVGSHDKGFWDASNPINANKQASATGLNVQQAIDKAKQSPGAELIVVKSDGKASVHSLSVEDSFMNEGKKIDIKELDRDPNKKQDMGKTPLAIDNNVAAAFAGSAAFLVDESSKVTYLGDDVDQTSKSVMLKDAEKFLSSPNRDKVDVAYQIATEGGDAKHVDRTVARQALDQLQQDYRQSAGPAQNVALLKPGDVRSKMEGLIGELKGIAGQENQRVTELRGQLNERTGKWQSDLKQPTQKLNAAVQAWEQANGRETQDVSKAAYNLREARMPNVHQLENTLEQARNSAGRARQNLDGAIENRVQAQGRVNDLERLPGEAQSHQAEARRLESENRGMHMSIKNYVGLTLQQVSSERRDVERSLQRTDSDLSVERNRPSRPTGGGDTHTTDPFASKPSGGVHTTDPFANGNKPSHTTDPFAGGSAPSGGYRDEGRINELERQGSRLRNERDDLRSRESGLESMNSRLMYTQDIDQLSIYFSNLNSIDHMALSGYKTRHDANERAASQQERSANEKQNRYNNEIGGARNHLSRASSDEEGARGQFSQAEGRVGSLRGQLQDLNANSRPDNHPEVKPALNTHQKAVDHKEATVGGQAPLTVTRDKAQTVVNDINRSYAGDRDGLEGQISNVQGTLQREATTKITQTRTQVAK
jgi:hypothetical protein